MLPVWLYRRCVSPFKPRCCRFHPTCSAYAMQALHERGAFAGSWLTLRRLLRCHPFTEPGFDPVPPVGRAIPPRASAAAATDRAPHC